MTATALMISGAPISGAAADDTPAGGVVAPDAVLVGASSDELPSPLRGILRRVRAATAVELTGAASAPTGSWTGAACAVNIASIVFGAVMKYLTRTQYLVIAGVSSGALNLMRDALGSATASHSSVSCR